jgi:hypothetical protein
MWMSGETGSMVSVHLLLVFNRVDNDESKSVVCRDVDVVR